MGILEQKNLSNGLYFLRYDIVLRTFEKLYKTKPLDMGI